MRRKVRRLIGKICRILGLNLNLQFSPLLLLWEPSSRDRDHLPPPEAIYNSFDEAIKAVNEWGKAHGVAYNKEKWERGGRYRLNMACNRKGKRRAAKKHTSERVQRVRLGAGTSKCGCNMQFWVVAEDYTNLGGQWRVKWAQNRRSITHNHPPMANPYAMARYRRATRTPDMRERLQAIFELARGTKQTLLMIREAFPNAVFSRQDVKNEYRQYQQDELGNRTRTDVLVEELRGGGYWYR